MRVMLEGKPLAGVVVNTAEADHSKAGEKIKTDRGGKASVVISDRGQQAINVFYKSPLKDDPDADKIGLSASLTFEVK